MTRTMAAMLAAIVVSGHATNAVAGAFPEIPLSEVGRPRHLAACSCLLAGAGLIGASFAYSYRAEQAYDEYRTASDPQVILRSFEDTERNDRWSNGTLIAGEVLIATGIYLRFLRPRPASRLAWSIDPGRCSVSWRF